MYPHRIRLRGPWQIEPLAQLVRHGHDVFGFRMHDLPAARTVNSPALLKDCGLPDFAGVVRYRRHFGLPRKLDEHETVWITCAGVADSCIVWLNAQRLANFASPRQPFEIEVTGELQDRNELWLDVHYAHANGNGGLCGDVAIEIRALAWIHDLQITLRTAREGAVIAIDGEVVGRSDAPLDFYAILDRGTIVQNTVATHVSGARFHFETAEMPLDGLDHALRVELVCGSNVWYTAEQTVILKKNCDIEL
ncbi:MAG TPA: hypothetical protein VGZ47_14945 [Gemmataceae bacterium]|jgi:hypothetical protein|nr:hypothetical protein [Gemmataceae bacterium]